MLPSYFIAGYYNISTCKFIQNSKHFYNLSKEDQEKAFDVNYYFADTYEDVAKVSFDLKK